MIVTLYGYGTVTGADNTSLAQMAEGVLEVLVSGSSIKQVVSAARPICIYQQNKLSPETIKRIMVIHFKLEGLGGSSLVEEDEDLKIRKRLLQKRQREFLFLCLLLKWI
jgi:negative regulator of replication initiation